VFDGDLEKYRLGPVIDIFNFMIRLSLRDILINRC
jgi:hypothetical protein